MEDEELPKSKLGQPCRALQAHGLSCAPTSCFCPTSPLYVLGPCSGSTSPLNILYPPL